MDKIYDRHWPVTALAHVSWVDRTERPPLKRDSSRSG
jgi:hypothetical protein